MIVGSQKEQRATISSTVLSVINDSNFEVTADQLSESYIVAETANVLSLPSANSIGENYVSIAVRYMTTGALDTGIIEKPNIIDTSNLAQGIIAYVVVEGDTLAAIAARNGLTATQIRWSNNMKNEALSVGQVLYLPSVPGILYTVRNDDTLSGLAEKYKTDAARVKALNNLEVSGLVVGQTIILPGGELPEKERPEYVPPAPRPGLPASVLNDSGVRHNMREIGSRNYWLGVVRDYRGNGNPSTEGQCTWYAWWWRRYYMPENYWLPSSVIGHAREWAATLSARGFIVNRTPLYGAVAQTRTTGYGHVAIVTSVVEGEYIVIQEMNYLGTYRVNEAKIYWEDALKYNYVHSRW